MPCTFRWRAAALLSVFAICGGMSALQAAPDLAAGALSNTRLIAAPFVKDGVWTIGVAITLKGKAITYWRTPGEAGVPPAFDFVSSTNVASAEVAYPLPKRISEADLDVIGYDGSVVFPVRVALRDPANPTNVHLKLDYATCERICLPAHADLSLSLPPSRDAVDAAGIDRAEKTVPRKLDGDAARAILAIRRDDKDGGASWIATPKESGAIDLFAEGPAGFFLTAKRDGSSFRVTVSDHPSDRAIPSSLRMTLVLPTEAVEFDAAMP